MKLNLQIIEADNIPKMDVFGKADPFVVVSLSESKEKDQTDHKSKTYTPRWDKQMYLKVISVNEYAKFELKDYDAGGKSDLIGTYQRKIKDFQPGIVKDEWITLEKAKGAKKEARLHIVSHLAFEEMTPFIQYPFQFLKVCVGIQSARGLQKANPRETFNPFVLVGLERCPAIRYKTNELKNTNDPVWNQDFPLELTNPSTDVISIILRDKTSSKEIDAAALSIPIMQIPPYAIFENEYDMLPLNGTKCPGKIKLRIQVLPTSVPNWTQMQMPQMYPPQQQMQPGAFPQQQMQPGAYPQQQQH